MSYLGLVTKAGVKIMKPQFVIVIIFLSFSVAIPSATGFSNSSAEYRSNIDRAVAYLEGKYDSHVGLLYESEDNGTHWLGNWTTYRNTYWLYSDNLEAIHVLEKYNTTLAENLSRTYDRYDFPKKTLLFGTLFGENIPDDIRDAENLAVVNTSDTAIIYRRHQGTTSFPYHQWSDALCYRAIDEYQFGDKEKAKTILKEALEHWNGLGFKDHATERDGFYANYKIGLFLYVADKMNYPLPEKTKEDMERQMWRQQNPDTGGMTSLADLSGKPIGSANVETTSLSLLPYTIRE